VAARAKLPDPPALKQQPDRTLGSETARRELGIAHRLGPLHALEPQLASLAGSGRAGELEDVDLAGPFLFAKAAALEPSDLRAPDRTVHQFETRR